MIRPSPRKLLLGLRDAMNQVGMNLAQRDQWPCLPLFHGSDLTQKLISILLDRGAGILRGET